MADRGERLKEMYTKLVHYGEDVVGTELWGVDLVVGGQAFRLDYTAGLDSAEWMRDKLANALQAIVRAEVEHDD